MRIPFPRKPTLSIKNTLVPSHGSRLFHICETIPKSKYQRYIVPFRISGGLLDLGIMRNSSDTILQGMEIEPVVIQNFPFPVMYIFLGKGFTRVPPVSALRPHEVQRTISNRVNIAQRETSLCDGDRDSARLLFWVMPLFFSTSIHDTKHFQTYYRQWK